MRRTDLSLKGNIFRSVESVLSFYDSDVLVIGAGLSGLTAAYKLCQRDDGLRVLVLEAKDRVGGRTLTVPLKTCDKTDLFDLGGQWVCSSQTHIINLLKELKLETYPQFDVGYKAGQAGTSMWEKFSISPVFGTWYCRFELYQFILKIEKLVKKSKLHDPLKCDFANELDSMTMETLLCKHLLTVTARDVMRTLIRITFGTEPCEISALFFVAFSNGTCGFLNQFKTLKNGARELRIKGGAQQISEILADKISKEFVRLNDAVIKIDQREDRIYVTTMARKLYRCEYIIMAIPPCEANRITFYPPLPVQRRKVMQRFPIGHLTTFVITYPKPYWRESGYSGETFSYGGAPEYDCDNGPISFTCDVTSERGSAAIMGYSTSQVGIQWTEKNADHRKRAVLEHLSRLWGPWALHPLDYAENNWSEEKYVGGCPTHFLTPGVMHMFRLQSPFMRIHWAGTETATQWCGYMNGAVQSGNRAAIEVLYKLRPQVVTFSDINEIGQGFQSQNIEIPYVPLTYQWKLWIPVLLSGVMCISYMYYLKYLRR